MIEVELEPEQLEEGRVDTLEVRLTNRSLRPCTHVVLCLKLPPHLVLLSGSKQIEIAKLSSGERAARSLKVRARQEGRFEIKSASFSFRDGFGQARHPEPFTAILTVLPARLRLDLPEPRVEAGIGTPEVLIDTWTHLVGWIKNVGAVPLYDVDVRLSLAGGEATRPTELPLTTVPQGSVVDFKIPVRAGQKGHHVPVQLTIFYRDPRGTAGSFSPAGLGLRVVAPQVVNGSSGSMLNPLRILFFAAEPINATPTASAQEFRKIEQEMRLSPHWEQFQLRFQYSTRIEELSRGLLENRPRIVHFSGHGEHGGSLCLESDSGREKWVSPDALARFFSRFTSHLECLVLNACYSEKQASEICRYIPFVIGMKERIGSGSAKAFSLGFYQALVAGRNIKDAFSLGCDQIALQGWLGSEVPVLKEKE